MSRLAVRAASYAPPSESPAPMSLSPNVLIMPLSVWHAGNTPNGGKRRTRRLLTKTGPKFAAAQARATADSRAEGIADRLS